MEIAYTVHTETCTLLLDARGVCRSVLAASKAAQVGAGRGRSTRIPSSAERCIGAQYVATLDLLEEGGLTQLPRPGAQMLFARTEQDGRITLVRTAPVVRFEQAAPAESGVHERPDSEPTLRRPASPAYGDDDETTLPFRPDHLRAAPARASSLPPPAPPAQRASSIPPQRRSSMPPPPVSASYAVSRRGESNRATIPPPPPTVRTPSYAPQPAQPRGPSVVRVSAPFWEAATQPFRRAAR